MALPVLFCVQLFHGLRDLKDDSSEFCGWDRTGTRIYFNTYRASFLEYMQGKWLPAVFPTRKVTFATFKTYLSKLGFQAESVDNNRTVYRFHSRFLRDSTEEDIRQHFPINPDTKPKLPFPAPQAGMDEADSDSDTEKNIVTLKRKFVELEQNYAEVQKRLTKVEQTSLKLLSQFKSVGRQCVDMHDHQLNMHQQYVQVVRQSRGQCVEALDCLEQSDEEESESC